MLYEAARANCYESTHFFWVDIGSIRNKLEAVPVQYPVPHVLGSIKSGAILWSVIPGSHIEEHWNNYKKASANDRPYELGMGQKGKDCPCFSLDGSAFGGDIQAVTKWNFAYYRTLDMFIEKGWFAGVDQHVYAFTCFIEPSICHFHKFADDWFDVQLRIFQNKTAIKTWILPGNLPKL
jgi:hypothetical protein